jgi:hypothetical protein
MQILKIENRKMRLCIIVAMGMALYLFKHETEGL